MAPVFASQKMGVLDIADAYGWREQAKLLPGIPTLASIQPFRSSLLGIVVFLRRVVRRYDERPSEPESWHRQLSPAYVRCFLPQNWG